MKDKYCRLNQRCYYVREPNEPDVLKMEVYVWVVSTAHSYVWKITDHTKTLVINEDVNKVMMWSESTRNAISTPIVGVFKYRKQELYYVDTRTDAYYKIPINEEVKFVNSIPDGIYPTAGLRTRGNASKTSSW